MTQTLGTDSNNDLYLGSDGNIVLESGVQAVMDACETATKAQLGEMLLATTQGIPNFQTIWVGSPNFPMFQTYLRNTLLSVSGVIDVKSIDITVQNNVLNYTATIETQFGTVQING